MREEAGLIYSRPLKELQPIIPPPKSLDVPLHNSAVKPERYNQAVRRQKNPSVTLWMDLLWPHRMEEKLLL